MGFDVYERLWAHRLNRCDENGYLAYVTNPRFELWLLLHYDIGEYMDAMKQPLKLKTTIRQLMDMFGIDGKDVDCTALIPKIPLAVEQYSTYVQIYPDSRATLEAIWAN